MQISARRLRLVLLATLVLLALPTVVDFAGKGSASPTVEPAVNESVPEANTSGLLDRPNGHVAYVVDAQGPGQLTVFNRTSGERVFHTQRLDLYHDVDPSPAGRYTVSYVASNVSGNERCPDDVDGLCTTNVIERLNYSTGERERLYARTLEYNGSSNTHDVDRIDDHHFLVGDIQFDRVFVVDVRTDTVEWTWNASAEFDRSSGGKAGDWTHLNDVGVVDESLYMVNLRNQDQVVFVERGQGMVDNLTLGSDDDHQTLYEQHNPDYIAERRGGPALLVADSENNRIVEYQHDDGTWNRSWLWSDERLQWPRDADRLPNNNTLVTDTHGTRLVEVTPNGSVVWTHTVPRGAYDAELLATGDESRTGLSMAAIRGNLTDGETNVASYGGFTGSLQHGFLDLFPPLVLHGFLFVLPSWVSPLSGALLLVASVLATCWGVAEAGRYGVRWYRA
ncbi:hypothetical protein ACKVMT_04855 [Halobacteriales archaeon Cl-PHB]